MSAELRPIKTMVYEHCGLVLDGIAEDRLRKIVHSNATLTGCTSLEEYEQLIRHDTQHFNSLVGQLTVNETYFFRDPEQIKLLTEVLIPQVLARKTMSEPVRILSAGCSSGEEPYSLVIALQEIYGARTAELFQIDAGDLYQGALDKAQTGIYSEFSFRGVDPAVRQRYFHSRVQGYELAPHIRQQVNFYQLNVLAEQFPESIKNYDIIFFRNVSIYFDLETRCLVQQKFFDLMRSESILLLGCSETLGNDFSVFELVEHAGQYFFIKGEAYRPANSQAMSWHCHEPAPITPMLSAASFTALPDNTAIAIPANLQQSSAIAVPEKSGLVDLYAIQQLILGGEAQRALRLLDALPAQESQSYGAYLLKSWLLINKQAFAEAEQLLEQALSIEPWSVDAILMKGLIFKWRNQENEACRWFKKAIYTCSECWPAHYYLAEIRRAEQDIDVAIQSYQRVLRVLAAYPSEDECMEWIPLPLAASDAEFLSQRYIQQLTAVSPSVQVDN